MTTEEIKKKEQAKIAFKMFADSMKGLLPRQQKEITAECVRDFLKDKTLDDLRYKYGLSRMQIFYLKQIIK